MMNNFYRKVLIFQPKPTCYIKENPADFGTRGIEASTLHHSDLWFNGTSFLLYETLDKLCILEIDETVSLKCKGPVKLCQLTATIVTNDNFILLFSNYNQLLYVITCILKLFQRRKMKFKIPNQ